jgi:hypothetical protein
MDPDPGGKLITDSPDPEPQHGCLESNSESFVFSFQSKRQDSVVYDV